MYTLLPLCIYSSLSVSTAVSTPGGRTKALLLIRIPPLIIIASLPVMGGRRMVHPMFRAGLDDVYELSILEYLLDVHLGADVLLGVLVAVVVTRGGGGGGLHNHSGNNSNSDDE